MANSIYVVQVCIVSKVTEHDLTYKHPYRSIVPVQKYNHIECLWGSAPSLACRQTHCSFYKDSYHADIFKKRVVLFNFHICVLFGLKVV